MKTFIEITDDRGYEKKCYARDNHAEYILTSAKMHDLYKDYRYRYDNHPTARWYHRHAKFARRITRK